MERLPRWFTKPSKILNKTKKTLNITVKTLKTTVRVEKPLNKNNVLFYRGHRDFANSNCFLPS
jgi:hypothetical protein